MDIRHSYVGVMGHLVTWELGHWGIGTIGHLSVSTWVVVGMRVAYPGLPYLWMLPVKFNYL